MKKLYKSAMIGLCSGAMVFLQSCGGSSDPTCDTGITIQTQVGNATCGASDGTITVTASGGDGQYQFSVDGGTAGSSNVLAGLSAGDHEVTVKDGSVCTSTMTVNVPTGVSFANQVASIINNSCAITGCHVPGTPRVDLTNFSFIQNNALDIKNRTQSGNMPRSGTLSPAEVSLIACWVDDGAQDN